MDLNLHGKKAIVCGSSQGIGKAIAINLASEGAEVTLVARHQHVLDAVLSELPGSNHSSMAIDFAEPASLDVWKEKIQDNRYSILVNNAGGPAPGPAFDASWADFEKAMHVHLRASHHLTQWIVPAMKEGGFGRIVNVISTSVKIPIPGLGVSNTLRGAMAAWAKTLSHELAPFGITVNNILPGYVETQRLKQIIQLRAEKSGKSMEQIASGMREEIPAGRFADPMEVGAFAAFLCSDKAAYLNGTSIPFDGGKTGAF
ncbi:MAG: SDR family oxidoreductase [Cyclobacteriaceae bacterium]|nr:SDR family oxidoreductase [Cyclobacteriaceae bacterium]